MCPDTDLSTCVAHWVQGSRFGGLQLGIFLVVWIQVRDKIITRYRDEALEDQRGIITESWHWLGV